MIHTWLWVGTIGMALGLLLIVGTGNSVPAERRHHVVVSGFVVVIAACAYFAMANNQGLHSFVDNDGVERTVYYARYLDWVLTTPLLLLGLLTVALPRLTSPGESRERNAVVGGVLGADVLMIVTGLFAALSKDTHVRWTWYIISCVAFLIVLYLIAVPIRAAAQKRSAEHAALYTRLFAILAVLWFIYPIVWAIGTEGAQAVGLGAEVAIFAVIDILAKVGFGVLLVTGSARLGAGAAERTPLRA
jgi:bacteriorhodopsin